MSILFCRTEQQDIQNQLQNGHSGKRFQNQASTKFQTEVNNCVSRNKFLFNFSNSNESKETIDNTGLVEESDEEKSTKGSFDEPIRKSFDSELFRVYRTISFSLNTKKNEFNSMKKPVQIKPKKNLRKSVVRKAFFLSKKPSLKDCLTKPISYNEKFLFSRLISNFFSNFIFLNSSEYNCLEYILFKAVKVVIFFSFLLLILDNFLLLRIFIYLCVFNLSMRAFHSNNNPHLLQETVKQW
jgi:hypothetical protein